MRILNFLRLTHFLLEGRSITLVGFLILPPLIVPSAKSVSADPLLSVSPSSSALSAAGRVKELCVAQQLMSSAEPPLPPVKPSPFTAAVRVKGEETASPPTVIGTNE